MKRVSAPLRLALLYLIISIIWVLASDAVVLEIAGNNDRLFVQAQRYKGLLFVALCSLLLYYLSKKIFANLNHSLKRSEELLNRYSALSEATKEGIADYDLVADEAAVNAQLMDFLGLHTFVVNDFSLVIRKKIHPDDLQRLTHSFRNTLNSAHTIWQSECRILWNDGTYHDVIYSGYIIRDKKTGQPLRFICAFQDVSELRNIQTTFYKKQIKQNQSLGITIIKAQEEERNRWALELHDNICQVLTVAKLYLDELAATYPNKLIPKTKDMVHNSLNDIRQLSASLKPPPFAITSLQESIEELHGNISRVNVFEFLLLNKNLNEELLNDDHKLMIYRIVQEQLNNITKYAEATSITVQLWNKDKEVFIMITDNGKGFEKDKVKSGIGLTNIQNRLQVFNGRMELKTAPGKGCTLMGSFEL